jgi:hypothetical protein
MFQDNLLVPCSRVKQSSRLDSLTLEDGTDMLSQNVSMELSFYAAVKSQKSADLIYVTVEAENNASECIISEEMKTSNLKYLYSAVKQRS